MLGVDKQCAKVVGVGQLLYDHVFTEQDDILMYNFSRGGGTVGNVLANLDYYQVPNMFVGVVGEHTSFGKRALEELELLGTDITLAHRLPTKNTLTIFQKTQLDSTGTPLRHEFTARCLVCGGMFDWNTTPKEEKYFRQVVEDLLERDISILFTDKITTSRAFLFQRVKQHVPEVKTLVDLGHVGHMRFWKVNRIVELLENVDMLFVSEEVAKFLRKRFKQESSTMKRFGSFLVRAMPSLKMLVFTQGADGLFVFSSTMNGVLTTHFPAPQIAPPVFPEGSGDALVAAFIARICSSGIRESGQDVDWAEVVRDSLSLFQAVLSHLGARGHIKMPELKDSDPLARYRGRTIKDLRKVITRRARCPFCGQTNLERISTDEMFRRVRRMKSSTIFQKSVRTCRESFLPEQTYAVVGTGGSYAPAAFITQLLLKRKGRASLFLPYQFLEFGIPVDWLLILSYSGRTRDYLPIIKHARQLGVKRVALITGNASSTLSRKLQKEDLVIMYETLPLLEKGFLSFSGVLLPATLCALAWYPSEIDPRYAESLLRLSQKFSRPLIEKIVEKLRRYHMMEIFWDAGAWPAFLDIETKLVESGIGAVVGHEFKNFSHGRFMFTMKGGKQKDSKHPRVLLQTVSSKYAEYLYQQLGEALSEPPILIRSQETGVRAALEILYRTNYLFIFIAQSFYKGKDVTKPSNIPKEGLKLYRFSDDDL